MEITIHKIITFLNTVVVLMVIFVWWNNDFVSTDTMSALSEKNEQLMVENERLSARLRVIEYQYEDFSERSK